MKYSELTSNVIECYEKAYELTLISIDLPNQDRKPTLTQLSLHRLYMELNPYALMTPMSIERVFTIIKKEGLKDFFIRLASRFYFLFNPNKLDVYNLNSVLWSACNIHAPLNDPINGIGIATNMLGEENSEQQLTQNEAHSLFNSNRWYTLVCLFTLIYTGA